MARMSAGQAVVDVLRAEGVRYVFGPVISISGDGDFLMNVQELETAVRWNIPVVAIVTDSNQIQVLG